MPEEGKAEELNQSAQVNEDAVLLFVFYGKPSSAPYRPAQTDYQASPPCAGALCCNSVLSAHTDAMQQCTGL